MTDQNLGSDDPTQVVPTPPPTEAVPAPLQPAPLQPVSTAPAGGAPKASRRRWAVALGAAALVVAITAGLVFALVGRSPDATVLGYVPTGAIAYGEVRLDLPGDQRQAVGEFLSHFPGFADQTALDTKLDEVLDRLVADASKDKQTFTKDIKPWFDGELAVSAGPLPDPKSVTSGGMKDLGNALVLLSIKDAAAAQAWFDAAFKEAGATTTTQTYDDTTLTVFSSGEPSAAFAIVDGKVAVAGEIDAVKAAIDTNGDSGFADDPDVKQALASVDGDHLAFAYVALKPLVDWTTSLQKSLGDQLGGDAAASLSGTMTQFLPDWGAYWLRVEGDAIVMEATAAKPQTALGATEDRASDVAKHVPSTAMVLAVGHDTGKTLQQTLEQYKSEPTLKEVTGAIDQALGVLGGADGAIGWIGDTGVVVNRAGDSIEGGLVILPTDAADASKFFTSIRNIASLSGAAGVTFSEQSYDGATISVATIDLAGLTGGAAGAMPQVFAMPLDKVEIAWAVTDDLVVIGSGPEFVKHVLDTTSATSLASSDQYKSVMDRVGTGTGSLFVDIAAIRGLAEGFMTNLDAAALKGYESDIKPFLAPLDALGASSSVEGDTTSSKVVITVK
jgi:hypothetical protein